MAIRKAAVKKAVASNYGVYVEGVSKDAVTMVSAAVMQVLAAPADEKTKRAALAAITQSLSKPVTISGANINMGV